MSANAVVPDPDHLHDAECRACFDVVGRELGLHRPDVFLEPRVERLIVGVAAEQRHRDVRVRVDESGDHERPRSVQRLGRRADRVVDLAGIADRVDRPRVAVDRHVGLGHGSVRTKHPPAGHTKRVHTDRSRPPNQTASVPTRRADADREAAVALSLAIGLGRSRPFVHE